MNYCDYLFDIPADWEQNTVLIDAGTDTKITYSELQYCVLELAKWLKNEGFKPGDVIISHLYNSAEAVLTHLAIQYMGGITCLLDPLITEAGLSYYLEDTNGAGLITRSRPEMLPEGFREKVKVISDKTITPFLKTRTVEKISYNAFAYQPDQLAAIFYTSGTTSQPKGVMLTPANFESHYQIFNQSCYQYKPEDRLLCFVPFSHGYGSKSIFIPCLRAGAAMVIMRSFHPVRVAEMVKKYKLTHIFGVPSHFQQLLRKSEFIDEMKKLKSAFSAAALLKLETAREWKKKVGYCLDEGYGLIETCTGVAFRIGTVPDRLGNIGTYPEGIVQIEILDDENRVLKTGELGEIAVKGPSVMLGYLNKPTETRRVLHEGWFRTGDLGYKTAENEIILAGRIKDVINVAGIKVAPFEIEAVLNEHPQVVESAVIGVDDEMYGEVVMAFIKPVRGANPDERELKKYLQKHLINFQVPREILVIDEFPRNNMGKIDKKSLLSQKNVKA